MNTCELIKRWPTFDDETRKRLLSVVATRGKNKGYVLERAPTDSVRRGAWNALVADLAPVRVETWSLMVDKEAGRVFADICDATTPAFGVALRAIEPDLRWNLFAYHADTEALRKALDEALLRETL